MADDEILQRVDLIQATLQLAFAPQLEAARERIRESSINAAILDTTNDWIPSKQLQARVAKEANVSERAVRDHLPELVARRIVAVRGTERRQEYRRTGLV